jgi:hypothetical protein
MGTVAGLHLEKAGQWRGYRLPAGAVRLVSRAPEVDARTATVAVILELDRSAMDLPIGSAFEAEVLLGGEKKGP